MTETRIDIISDTHSLISPELRRELTGADYIIHAGDITSPSDFRELQSIAKVKVVLGNNDFDGMYGALVEYHAHFVIDGVTFDVAHYEQNVHPESADVVVFGHTHRPVLDWRDVNGREVLFVNPGSPTFPRGGTGASLARLWIKDSHVLRDSLGQDPEIIELTDERPRFGLF